MRFFILLMIMVIGGSLTDSIATGILLGLVFLFANPTGGARLDDIETELAKLKTEIERLKQAADTTHPDTPSETASETPPQKTQDSAESAAKAAPSENRTTQAAHVRTSPAAAADAQRFRIPDNGSAAAFGQTGTDTGETAAHAGRPSEKPVAAKEQPAAALSGVHASQAAKAAERIAADNDRPSENGLAAQPVSAETAEPLPKAENPLLAWFMRGNMLLRAGVVILFLGLAFLLRLASEYIHVSIGTRYVMVAAAGVAATAAGWRLQKRRREYGLVLQGFGVAVMYLTSLAALKLHPLLPAAAVFATMVALTVLMALLAVRQNALVLAQFALLGGLAAPVLVSDGSGNYLVLFSYLAVLNAGVAAIAWFKAWRSLNITGFAGTFTMGAVWGAGAYTPQHFATTEPFLIYHWLLYTLVACLFARRLLQDKPYEGRLKTMPDNASLPRMWQTFCAYGLHVDALDSTLLFGTALAAFGLQYPMVAAWEYGAAWSALGFAAVYALLAVFFRRHERFAVLKQAFAALALLFGTLAVPLALEQQWTAAVWTVEAALVYLFALQQRQPHTRLIALGVYTLAALTQLEEYSLSDSIPAERLLDGPLLGTVLAAGGGGLIYWLWFTRRRNGSAVWEKHFQTAVLSLAVLHAALLPFMLFAERGSMAATAVLAAVWAWCARRSGSSVFASATVLSGIVAGLLLVDVLFLSSSDDFILPALACAIPMLWAAYALQKPPSENLANGFIRNAGWVQLAAALGFGVLAVLNGLIHIETDSLTWLRPTWWTLPLFALPLAVAAKRSGWTQLLLILPLFTVLFAWTAFLYDFPQWPWAGLLVLAAAGALHFYILNALPYRKYAETLHAAGLLLFGTLWTKFCGTLGNAYLGGVWAQLAWAAVPLILWVALYTRRNSPFIGKNRTAYWHIGSAVCAVALAAWLLWTNIVRLSAPAPLPYLPLANPLEIASAAMLWQAFRWLNAWMPQNWPEADKRRIYAVPLALAFVFLSAGVMRVWHFIGGVEWNIATLLASFGLQASLSIVWALTAIVLMVRGNQSRRRTPWVIGASLMGVVVVKLFLVELGNSGGIARIVSFIVVGLLLLLVGWFAPVPPKDGEEKAE